MISAQSQKKAMCFCIYMCTYEYNSYPFYYIFLWGVEVPKVIRNFEQAQEIDRPSELKGKSRQYGSQITIFSNFVCGYMTMWRTQGAGCQMHNALLSTV